MAGSHESEVTNRQSLERELALIREQGFAELRRETVVAVGYPIFLGGKITGGMGSYLPLFRLTDSHAEKLHRELSRCAAEITNKLGNNI